MLLPSSFVAFNAIAARLSDSIFVFSVFCNSVCLSCSCKISLATKGAAKKAPLLPSVCVFSLSVSISIVSRFSILSKFSLISLSSLCECVVGLSLQLSFYTVSVTMSVSDSMSLCLVLSIPFFSFLFRFFFIHLLAGQCNQSSILLSSQIQ